MIELNEAQQNMLDEALARLADMEADAFSDYGDDVDICHSDLVESAALDISDPIVRREFYRIQGCQDRQTGYDPMEWV